jgi:hypothetical protein
VLAAPPRFPAISGGVALAIGAAAAAAAVLYLASLTGAAFFGGRPRLLLDAGKRVLGAAGLLVVGGVVIPAVMWGSVWLSATRPAAFHAVSSVTTAGAGTVVLAYVGTLVGVLWRSRRTVSSRGPAAAGLLRKRPSGGSFATTLFQRVIIYAALTVLCVALLVLFGLVATWAGSWPGWLIVTLVAVLAAVGALLDQTWLSMHPFYRRRLASAIAVRRGRTRGRVAAAPYSFAESTPLTEYADPARYPGFPKVIFAAAANLSGQDRTPPNRRATQFTFASDYVGGPEVGWVSTAKLSEIVSRQVRRDLTTQAAVAISGAAFASAMGVQSRPYDTFFALTNARLGSWLPNPGFLIERAERANWAVPRLPRLRRLSYLLREIFGLFPSDDRMLLCTDGGHYDNLGLIELLRHRCKLIYCIDASGDSPPLAQSLGGTVALAREELGVEIALTDPLDLVPGSAGRLEPHDPLAGLNHRLSAAAVRTGTITYPADVTFPGGDVTRTGRLVFAKASLTADMPYELLSYAIQNVAFPHDSTGDQWFDHRQFDSYTQLGQILGHRAAEAAGAAPQPPGGAAP